MSKKEYKELLDNHDWTYMFSDDSRKYTEGKKNEEYLKKLAKDNDLQEMYDQKLKENFKS